MLTLNRITLKNFGPYKGKQSIDFPKDGIVIVYGDNMRGKTSLLNAIRYSLYGKVLGRGSQEQSLHQLSNWEEAEKGRYGFSVVLEFNNNNNEYELTRNLAPAKGIEIPQRDADYVQHYYLKKNDVVLSPEDTNLELSQIMPEQVSRFFLFDGELLQEYEELLRQESEMGDRITKAIERILGVPVLTNARTDVNSLLKKAQKQASIAAQKDQKTRELGNYLEDLSHQIAAHETEIERMTVEKEELQDRKSRLDEELRSYERIKAWLDERDNLVEDVKNIENQLKQKIVSLKEYMALSWRTVLERNIRELQTDLQNRRDTIQKRVNESALTSLLQKALLEDYCPVCKQRLSESVKQIMSDRLTDKEAVDNRPTDIVELEQTIFSIKVLQGFTAQDITLLVRELIKDLDYLKVDKASKQDQIKEIDRQAKDYDQSKVRALYSEHTLVIKKIALLEDGIEKENEEIKSLTDDVRKLDKKLANTSGNESSIERKRYELYSQLHELFDDGVGLYRDNLRKRVEGDATRLFLELTSEPDYGALRITESYGLVIVHKDGKEIPVRSAGAEHIVALSLMGALHKNAPLSGPIIMDSPFGRLDEVHTSKVVRSLPQMADQIILLVYKSELLPSVARETLKGELKSEYKLTRQSARHTTIEKNFEG